MEFDGINDDFEKSQTFENKAGVLVNLVLSAEIIKNKLPPIRNIFLIFERRAENLSKHCMDNEPDQTHPSPCLANYQPSLPASGLCCLQG